MHGGEVAVDPGSDRFPVLAVDIGGTKMAAAMVDGEGSLLSRAFTPTPSGVGAEDLFATLVTVIEKARSTVDDEPVVCGVGCGGPMAKGGVAVSPLNIHGWRDFPLRGRLADTLGIPVAVDNDAKALALGEGWRGAARHCANYIAMVVSTGVGGGIVLDGRLLDGSDGNAGHVGHVVVEPEGRPCVCGGRGCLEAEASGPSIADIIGRPVEDAPLAARQRAGTLVGRAVASVANLLDLELAVVAGSVALGFGTPFFEAAQKEIAARACLDFSRPTRIVRAGLGAEGPLVGAAAVGLRQVPVARERGAP